MIQDYDPDVVKSFIARIRRTLTQAKGQSIRMEVHSRQEAEDVRLMLSPAEQQRVKLHWKGPEPAEAREL